MIEYRGHKIRIEIDCDPDPGPRDWDNLGTMVCFHKHYNLGDKDAVDFYFSNFGSWEEMADHIEAEFRPVVLLPLHLYDHGGITMSVDGFSCPFDSGQVGFIFAPRHKVLSDWRRKKLSAKLHDQVDRILRYEVDVYDRYLRGEVYGFLVEGPCCNDRCWGFYDDEDYVLSEAKAAVDASITQLELPFSSNGPGVIR